MLTFFRKIRKNLQGSGQTRKYLLYAIGEIALVVIGILIALQVNNWNERRKDRQKEQKILETLAENLERNCTIFKDGLHEIQKLNRSSSLVLDFFEGKVSYNDSLDNDFFYAQRTGVMQGLFSSEGYENYKNAGFDIILSDTLKREVLLLFEKRYPVVSAFRQVLLVNNFDEYSIAASRYFRKNKPFDATDLYHSNEMYEMYRAANDLRASLEGELKLALGDTEKVLRMIRDKLDRE